MHTVTIVGSGYVGLTTGAILASTGFKVYLLDVDEGKIDTVKSGKSHFYEAGLDELIQDGLRQETLLPTTSYKEAIPEADIVISCVGTPDNPDGSPNLQYIYDSARETGRNAKNSLIYVQKSTVPVGTSKEVMGIFDSEFENLDVSYVSNPEFLRESSAISDSLFGDRIVLGGSRQEAIDSVRHLYEEIDKNKEHLAEISGIDASRFEGHALQVVETSLESAELIKVTANAFLALKISFANSIAKLADAANADILEVMDGVGLDKRIGRAFLNAGRGYGGGCFPKDVSGLISTAYSHGIDLHIMNSASELNDSMPGYVVNRAKSEFGQLKDVKVAVLGLAFKPGTSDVRKSPAVAIANSLAHEGAEVTAYDPKANNEASDDLNRSVKLSDSVESALEGSEVVFVATDWPEFKQLDYAQASDSSLTLVVDCMNAISPETIEEQGLRYLGVGRGEFSRG